MRYMTLAQIDRALKSDKEILALSLQELKKAKANFKKARITSISNKLLAPFRRFQVNLAIAKYALVEARAKKEREKEEIRAEILEEKEREERRKEAKAEFKDAIRDKRKENINNFAYSKVTKAFSFMINTKNTLIDKVKRSTTIDLVIKTAISEYELKKARNKYNKAVDKQERKEKIINGKKSQVIDFSKDLSYGISNTLYNLRNFGTSKVTRASSFMINAKNSLIDKVKQSTTIDLVIKEAITEFELKRARNKYNKALEEQEKQREIEREKALEEQKQREIERKKETVPFYNIKEKIQKASRQQSYMGKATNRAISYFKSKKEKITDKVLETQFDLTLSAYTVMGKVSRAKSKLAIEFNNQIDKFKGRANSLKESINEKIDDVKTSYENMKENIKNRRDEKNRDISIKRAQLDSVRAALNDINKTGSLIEKAPSLDNGLIRR